MEHPHAPDSKQNRTKIHSPIPSTKPIRQIQPKHQTETLQNMYIAITYASTAWRPTAKYNLQLIETAQNKILTTITISNSLFEIKPSGKT